MGIVEVLPADFLGVASVGIRNYVANVVNSGITCGTRDAARARVNAGVKAWRYRYYGEWPNQHLAPRSGAFFGSEIPLVFGSAAYYTDIPDVPEEAKLSSVIRQAWAEFAKDPKNGLTKFGWPSYDESSKSSPTKRDKERADRETVEPSLIRLGYQNKAVVTFESPKEYDKACDTGNGLITFMSGAGNALNGLGSAFSNLVGSLLSGRRGGSGE
jgi:hypothetical protein